MRKEAKGDFGANETLTGWYIYAERDIGPRWVVWAPSRANIF